MVLFATLAFVSVGCSSISVVHVPNNYSTIQSAVNATNPGDTAKNLNLSLEISKPTSEDPANAGPFNDPQQIFVVASLEVIGMSTADMLRLAEALYSDSPFIVLVGEKKADIIAVNATPISEMWLPTGIRGNMTINPPKQESVGYYDLTVIENVFGTNISDTEVDAVYYEEATWFFDTNSGTYPSIMGIHTGTIIPSHEVHVSKMYTYPCEGTGGHSEYVKFWNESWNITANWEGYQGDWHNISFNNYPFTLREGEPYNYTIRTGSYPQIIHEKEFNATGGTITCIEFVDANGKVYNDWTPAIRLH